METSASLTFWKLTNNVFVGSHSCICSIVVNHSKGGVYVPQQSSMLERAFAGAFRTMSPHLGLCAWCRSESYHADEAEAAVEHAQADPI